MVKVRDAYECEKCGSVYTTQGEASGECEEMHADKEDLKISEVAKPARMQRFPDWIEITDSKSGVTHKYLKQKFDGEIFKQPQKQNTNNTMKLVRTGNGFPGFNFPMEGRDEE